MLTAAAPGQEALLRFTEADLPAVRDRLEFAAWRQSAGYQSARRLLGVGSDGRDFARKVAAQIALHLIYAHLERRHAT